MKRETKWSMKEHCEKLFTAISYQWKHEFLYFPVNTSACHVLENTKGKDNMECFVALFRASLCLDTMCTSVTVQSRIIYRCRYFVISTASQNTSERAL